MVVKRLLRRLPPIAWRDARLRAWKKENTELRSRLARAKTGPVALPDRDGAIELVRSSRLFDAPWYRSQAPHLTGDPVEHFIDHGQEAGLSPHPLFVPGHYEKQFGPSAKEAEVIRRQPLVHYLAIGAARGLSPHPLFDAKAYGKTRPGAKKRPGGAIADFLARGEPLTKESGATGEPWDNPQGLLEAGRSAAEAVRSTRGFTSVDRDTTEFDLEQEADTKARLRESPLPTDLPLVSIIIPTKDRAEMLGETIDSVLAQTYPHWELLITDDGSRDTTPELLSGYAAQDDRVRIITHPEARGVSAARNSGLAQARGRYIAYLDSDNTWFSDFLELMVRHLIQSGDRVAYGVTVLDEEGGKQRRLYRAVPFDREHLRERNYIDCIVLVHERELLASTGVFDETLRRNVDWDLFIRLAEETDFTLVPVRATQYDVWSERGERITTQEPMAYRYIVRQRTLVDFESLHETALSGARVQDVLSVVIVLGRLTGSADAQQLALAIRRMIDTASRSVEVVVVDSRSTEEMFVELHARLGLMDEVILHRLTQPLSLEVARNVGASLTSGEDLAFLPANTWTQESWDQPLREALSRHVATFPLLLTAGGAVWSAGQDFLSSGHWYHPYSGFAGDAPEVRRERAVSAAPAAALAMKARTFFAVGGFDPLVRDDLYGAEFSLRLKEMEGGTIGCIPRSVVAWREDPPEGRTATALLRARENQRLDRERWRTGQGLASQPDSVVPGYRLIGFSRNRNTQVAPSPLFVHDRPQRPLRWALKIGAPTVERRTNWGDWHFAESLRDSLERLGHEVSIDCKEEWYRPTSHLDDVVLQLRGVSVYEVNPGHTNLAWVISHPDRVTATELLDYDLAFGASPRWCEGMSNRLGRPVTPLLQCTDHHRFHPVEPDWRRSHDVLAVANARGLRRSVRAALEAGVVPAVYGLRWGGLVPQGAWQGEYIPNAELPAVYCAAGVVLNDHWDDMRDLGILSNRLFDLAACEARVISDYLPEISQVFGDVILTFDDASHPTGQGASGTMVSALRTQLSETPERAQARKALGQRVRQEHTFDARARQLSEAVSRVRSQEASLAK